MLARRCTCNIYGKELLTIRLLAFSENEVVNILFQKKSNTILKKCKGVLMDEPCSCQAIQVPQKVGSFSCQMHDIQSLVTTTLYVEAQTTVLRHFRSYSIKTVTLLDGIKHINHSTKMVTPDIKQRQPHARSACSSFQMHMLVQSLISIN